MCEWWQSDLQRVKKVEAIWNSSRIKKDTNDWRPAVFKGISEKGNYKVLFETGRVVCKKPQYVRAYQGTDTKTLTTLNPKSRPKPRADTDYKQLYDTGADIKRVQKQLTAANTENTQLKKEVVHNTETVIKFDSINSKTDVYSKESKR